MMFTLKAITLLLAYFAGLFIVPFLLFRLPMNATKLPYFDNIYGNAKGLTTDGLAEINKTWYHPATYFPRFYWLVWRNPANKLGYEMGAHGVITKFEKSKPNVHTLGHYQAKATVHYDVDVGTEIQYETVRFVYGTMKWPLLNLYFRYAFGTKLWSNYKVGDTVDSGYALSVLPFISKRTAGLGANND